MSTVLYLSPRPGDKKWFNFLRATLSAVPGVERILDFDYHLFLWGGKDVIFFDLDGAPTNWPEVVYHLARQDNRVIVLDVNITAVNAHKAGQAGAVMVMDKTIQPKRIVGAFQQAARSLLSPYLKAGPSSVTGLQFFLTCDNCGNQSTAVEVPLNQLSPVKCPLCGAPCLMTRDATEAGDYVAGSDHAISRVAALRCDLKEVFRGEVPHG